MSKYREAKIGAQHQDFIFSPPHGFLLLATQPVRRDKALWMGDSSALKTTGPDLAEVSGCAEPTAGLVAIYFILNRTQLANIAQPWPI